MSDEIPSPADDVHELSRLPWETALYDAMQRLEHQLEECRRANAKLRLDISQLNARLRRANEARERWQLRMAAWQRERDALLQRLSDDGRRR